MEKYLKTKLMASLLSRQIKLFTTCLIGFLCLLSTSSAQEIRAITGEVADDYGKAVGVAVVVKGTQMGATTDSGGKFTINAKTGDILVVSLIGYKMEEIQVGDGSHLRITLQSVSKDMEEIVVVGYGTQKRVNLTGSVSTIGSDILEKRPAMTTSSILQGVAPGVTVTTQSGSPGGDGGSIRIRGINAFGGSSSAPLVLIDGVEAVMDYLDPNLIESISVLKDAASAAIYGSRAANGVILITTKRATGSKMTVNYKGSVGWQSEIRVPRLASGLDYMDVYNQASTNDGKGESYPTNVIDQFKEDYAANPSNYDWQDAILQGSGFTQTHFVSLAVKSNKIFIAPSFSYSEKQGLIKNTDYKRYVFRNNMDVEVLKNLKLKLDISFTNGDRKQIGNEGTVWGYFGRMPNIQPIRNDDGSWAEGWVNINPIGYIEDGGNRKTNNIELLGNLMLTYEPFSWLSLTGQIAPRYRTNNGHSFVKAVMTYRPDGTESGSANPYTHLTESSSRYFFENYQFYATASKTWGDHSLAAILGTSREDYNYWTLSGFGKNFPFLDYEVLDADFGRDERDSGSSRQQRLDISLFGRLTYNYKERYLFEMNVRRDATSRFAKHNRWSMFPSFSAAWRISEEDFMKDTKHILDQLKIRASYGSLGSSNVRGNYPAREQLAMGSISMNDALYPLVTLNTMANPNLKWEETTSLNFGLDVTMFRKLSVTVDWYRKITKDILLTLPVSDMLGLNAPSQNAATVKNVGWELGVNYNNRWGDFDLGVGFNISDVKNEITDMRGMARGSLVRNQEGYAVNSIFGLIADGYYQSYDEIAAGPSQGIIHPGDIKYRDVAGAFDADGNSIPDGVINDNDRVVFGSTIPRYTYGLNLNLGWKGIRLNAFFQGVGKVDGYLSSFYVIPCVSGAAVKEWQLDYWRDDNQNAQFPRLSIEDANNQKDSSHWMKSAAYLRLKNLQLGYSLPKKFISKIGVKELYIYVNAENLLTFTDFWKGYDPEIAYDSGATDNVSLGGGGVYPQVRVVSLGLDIKF